MRLWSGWIILLLAVVCFLVAPAEAWRRPLSDEELDMILAGQTKAKVSKGKESPTSPEPTEVPLTLAGVRVTRTVQSLKDLRQRGVVPQALDYSCGAAALSTVATYFFQDPITETEVIAAILVTGQTPQEGVRKYFRRRGFTLLDLKRAAEARGYRGTGYRGMTLEDLVETIATERVPVLVPINPFGYYHFVVVRGVKGDRVFVADPAVGKMTMKVARFEDVWVDGIGFVLGHPARRASRSGTLLASAEGSGLPAAAKSAASNGNLQAEPQSRPSNGAPPLLTIEQEAVPDSSQLQRVIDRSSLPPPNVPTDMAFDNQAGSRVLSMFVLQNYNAAIQYGRPAGNFIDFSPPPGGSIHIQP